MPTTSPMVAVYGASGHTGRFVVAEARRRGWSVVAIGRDRGRLATVASPDVKVREAAVDDPRALDAAITGAHAVLNLAGPFLDTAEPVANAAVRAGASYLDVTAEQSSTSATLEDLDAPARAAGVAVVPAMGFFGGLADLLVTAATMGWTTVDEVEIRIGIDRWWPTAGTRATGARNTAPRWRLEAGGSILSEDPPVRATLRLPPPFGTQPVTSVAFSEVPLIAHHLRVGRLRTWLADSALADLHDPETPPPVAVDNDGRSAQQFVVEVEACSGATTTRVTAAGQDIYAVTAPLLVEAAARCLDADGPVGALAPGAAFDAADLLTTMTSAHLAVDLTRATGS